MEQEKGRRNEVKELPPELWGEIGKLIESTMDLQMFRSTCKSWRHLLPSPFPPLFPMVVPALTNMSSRKISFVSEHTGYLIKPETNMNPTFMIFGNKFRRDGPAFFLYRLFTPYYIDNEMWPRPQKLDLQRHQTSLLFKTYYFHCYSTPSSGLQGTNRFAQKVILLSYFTDTNRSTRINPQFAAIEPGIDVVLVALLRTDYLACLTYGSTEWKIVEQSRFDDIFNHGGKLWSLDYKGGVFVMSDYRSFNMTQVAASPVISNNGESYIWDTKTSRRTPIASPYYPKRNGESQNNYNEDSPIKGNKVRLVECCGKLYMLFPCRGSNKKHIIRVFELESSRKEGPYPYEWVEVESIGNKAFFVGIDFGFSMVGSESGLEENCIYLTGGSFCPSQCAEQYFPLFEEMSKRSRTIGVYSLMDKEFRKMSTPDCPQIFCTAIPPSMRNRQYPTPINIPRDILNCKVLTPSSGDIGFDLEMRRLQKRRMHKFFEEENSTVRKLYGMDDDHTWIR